jgi:hypothetical protein
MMSSDALSSSRNDLSDADNDEEEQGEEEEVVQETTASSGGKSQESYIASGNDKKKLYLLCVGLNRDHEQPLYLFETEPWSLLPKTVLMRPQNKDYVHEIVRRATLFNITPIPRPSNWNKVQKMEWLQQNPVRDRGNIEFLTNEVLRLEEVLTRKVREQQELQSVVGAGGQNSTSTSAGGGRGHWRGSVPYLCIIMSLTQDNVKCLFLTGANSRSRQELDARNTDTR